MKKLLFLFVVLISSFTISCSDDDPAPVDEHPCALLFPPPHSGTWNLINVSGSIAGVSHDFEPGVIKWKFEFCPHSGVTVTNNNDNEQVEDFLETGHYEISYTEYDADAPGCPQYWIIGSTDFGCMEYSEDEQTQTLTLTQQVADGYTLTFIR